jgi:hypothetical protein
VTAVAVGSLPGPSAPRAGSEPAPLEQVSGPSLFADCTADFQLPNPGTVYLGSEVEPWIAVDPRDPLHVAAVWQQDRWSSGGARGLAAGVSFDGGITWRPVVIPGLTWCSGGKFLRASDPWISFSPNGDLHQIAIVFDGVTSRNGVVASKSTDGGMTWGVPVPLAGDVTRYFHDKESITADPTDANVVYAVWDRVDGLTPKGPAMVTRSADGGATWEPIRVLHDPPGNSQTLGNQIVVLPDGKVMAFFTEILNVPGGPVVNLAYKWSVNKGQLWRPGASAVLVRRMAPRSALDPERELQVRDGAFLFDVAVDPRNGFVYAVWQDEDVSPQAAPAVAFTMSRDGGTTWSAPAAVNRTPADVPLLNRQAFAPSVHVTESGIVGVSYFDFRRDGPEPEALTDHWLAWCHPEGADCSRADRWREEARLTETSFDILEAPLARGLFLGDYFGLASSGDAFLAAYAQPHDGDPASIFVRRVEITPRVEPEGLGSWKRRARTAPLGDDLAEIQVIHDVFDDVAGPDGLRAVLDPHPPAGPRGRARQHLMALLLNVVSGRLSPFAEVGRGLRASDAARSIIGTLTDPGATPEALESAKALAEALNEGRIPVD